MDESSIYSCDDHLDLRSVRASCGRTGYRRIWPNGARGS